MEVIECLECGTSISVEPESEKKKVTCPECLISMNVSKSENSVNIEYSKGFSGRDGHPQKADGYEDMSFGKYD